MFKFLLKYNGRNNQKHMSKDQQEVFAVTLVGKRHIEQILEEKSTPRRNTNNTAGEKQEQHDDAQPATCRVVWTLHFGDS